MESIGLPHFPQNPKSLTFHSLPQCNLYGIVSLKRPSYYNKKFAALGFECASRKAVNNVISVLNYYIKNNLALGSSLVLVSDNTAREMKNHYFLSYLQYLCIKGILKEVYLFFPEVGHTHWLADQEFSSIKRIITKKELWIPEQAVDYITKNNSKYQANQIEAKVLWQIYNWKSAMEHVIRPYHGISSNHGFFISTDSVKHREITHEGDWSEQCFNLFKSIPTELTHQSLFLQNFQLKKARKMVSRKH
jgi:hypothetical protein